MQHHGWIHQDEKTRRNSGHTKSAHRHEMQTGTREITRVSENCEKQKRLTQSELRIPLRTMTDCVLFVSGRTSSNRQNARRGNVHNKNTTELWSSHAHPCAAWNFDFNQARTIDLGLKYTTTTECAFGMKHPFSNELVGERHRIISRSKRLLDRVAPSCQMSPV